MGAVDQRTEQLLTDIVGERRIRTDQRERKMYSFDIGAMPSLVKPLVPAGVAGAVVRPKTEDLPELIPHLTPAFIDYVRKCG